MSLSQQLLLTLMVVVQEMVELGHVVSQGFFGLSQRTV